MAYSKKTWKDRITEYPNRRELTHSDSSTELVTVARSEGTISQEGDAFSAQNMNDLEGRIDSEFSAVDQNLQDINDNLLQKVTKFSGTASGNTYVTVDGLAYDATNKKLGLKVNGADTVIPFSGGLAFEDLGEVSSTTLSNGYFSNLDIGKTYLFSWYLNGSSSSARGYITLTSGAKIVNNYYKGAGAGSIQELIFKATSTTVNFSVSYPSGSSGNDKHLFKLCD